MNNIDRDKDLIYVEPSMSAVLLDNSRPSSRFTVWVMTEQSLTLSQRFWMRKNGVRTGKDPNSTIFTGHALNRRSIMNLSQVGLMVTPSGRSRSAS